MRNITVNYLLEEAKKNPDIFMLTGDVGYSVLDNFMAVFPERCINIGIAEQNMIGIAAGLALSGKKVFVYSFAPFAVMRCFEQIRVDLCYQNLDVTIIGLGGGFAYGTSGTTHNALEDMTIMRSLPNMKVMCPADPNEAVLSIKRAIEVGGPNYIRLNRGNEKNIADDLDYEKIKVGEPIEIIGNNDKNGTVILSCGNILSEARKAVSALIEKGKNISLYSCPFLKPLNKKSIIDIIKEHKTVITVEEHTILGALGSAVAEIIAEERLDVRLKRLGIEDKYFDFIGQQDFMRNTAGISAEKIEKTILEYE